MKTAEIWLVNFSPSIGDEIKKARPAVLVGNDDMGGLDLCIVVPFTNARQLQRRWHVKVKPTVSNNLKKESLVDCFQVKSISTGRLVRKIGNLSANDMEDVKVCLTKVLDLV